MRLKYPRRPVEQPLESLDEYRSQRSRSEIARHALMSLENAIVLGYQGEQGRQWVFGGNEWEDIWELSGEVVDL